MRRRRTPTLNAGRIGISRTWTTSTGLDQNVYPSNLMFALSPLISMVEPQSYVENGPYQIGRAVEAGIAKLTAVALPPPSVRVGVTVKLWMAVSALVTPILS